MHASVPPFAPTPVSFPGAAIAAAAARAALGGPREALLGALMAARLAEGLLGPYALPLEVRRARAAGAKSWLTALAVPSKTRAALQKAIAASATEDRSVLADALDAVTEVTAPHLDNGARSELGRVVAALRD